MCVLGEEIVMAAVKVLAVDVHWWNLWDWKRRVFFDSTFTLSLLWDTSSALEAPGKLSFLLTYSIGAFTIGVLWKHILRF